MLKHIRSWTAALSRRSLFVPGKYSSASVNSDRSFVLRRSLTRLLRRHAHLSILRGLARTYPFQSLLTPLGLTLSSLRSHVQVAGKDDGRLVLQKGQREVARRRRCWRRLFLGCQFLATQRHISISRCKQSANAFTEQLGPQPAKRARPRSQKWLTCSSSTIHRTRCKRQSIACQDREEWWSQQA